jgi:hypothetical protein
VVRRGHAGRRHLGGAAPGAGGPAGGLGEAPIAYPDTEPVHLNVARLDRLDDPAAADALLAAPPDLDRLVTLRTIEVVVTDFLVSPGTLQVLGTITLQ